MWGNLTHLQYWSNRQDCVMMKEFGLELNSAASHYLLGLNKKTLWLLVGVLTGHNTLNKHLHRMNLFGSPLCNKCGLEYEETSAHFLCECNAYLRLRLECFGSYQLPQADVKKTKFANIVKFITNSGRLDMCVNPDITVTANNPSHQAFLLT